MAFCLAAGGLPVPREGTFPDKTRASTGSPTQQKANVRNTLPEMTNAIPTLGRFKAVAAGEGAVRSPLPGKIIDLRVKVGDTVSRGQPLLVLEAMKMEHTLAAPADGTVKSVRYAVGEQVPEGAELVEFE